MAALDSLRDKWESITPRERRMVVLLGAATVVVLVLYVALGIRDGMVKLEHKNSRSRQALAFLTTLKTKPIASGDQTEIPSEAVRLESYLFAAASKAGVTLGGVTPKGNSTRGSYTVHGASVELRELTLQQATDFLEAIENDSKVVMVTGLQVRRNFREKAKVELSVEVSTYAKAAAAPAEPAAGGNGKGTGGGS